MITINLDNIARDLPAYLPRLNAGETVLIVQNDRPVAELKPVPITSPVQTLRPFGLCAGQFQVPADFDTPLPDDLLTEFEGV